MNKRKPYILHGADLSDPLGFVCCNSCGKPYPKSREAEFFRTEKSKATGNTWMRHTCIECEYRMQRMKIDSMPPAQKAHRLGRIVAAKRRYNERCREKRRQSQRDHYHATKKPRQLPPPLYKEIVDKHGAKVFVETHYKELARIFYISEHTARRAKRYAKELLGITKHDPVGVLVKRFGVQLLEYERSVFVKQGFSLWAITAARKIVAERVKDGKLDG